MKKLRSILSVIIILQLVSVFCACASQNTVSANTKQDTSVYINNPILDVNHIIEQNSVYKYEHGELVFSIMPGFYDSKQTLKIEFADKSRNGTIYYTIDGSKPTVNSNKLTDSLRLTAQSGKLSKIYVVRAFAVYDDGTQSEEIAGTFFVNSDIKDRYTTVVISIMGDSAELTDGPQGIYIRTMLKRAVKSPKEKYILKCLMPMAMNCCRRLPG